MDKTTNGELKEVKKLTFEEKVKDFFIPRNFFDVVFLFICILLAWYAMFYDIENSKVPVICANWWNKWAASKANYLGIINATEEISNFVLNISINNTGNFTLPH